MNECPPSPSGATAAIPDRARAVHLVARPDGPLTTDAFRGVEVPVPDPGPGHVLVRTGHLGVAAVMRERMDLDGDLPVPPYALDEPMSGPAVGTVVASRAEAVPVGALVAYWGPWAEYAEVAVEAARVLDPALLPAPQYHLATANGATALHGVRDVAGVGRGDVVLVSGAAGGVGSLAGQIARRLGAARVIGTAGSAAKCRWLVDELGFDAAVDHHVDDLAGALREHAPDGVTVYLDLVGGAQFEAAVAVAATHARFAVGGALSTQQAGAPWPRFDTGAAIVKALAVRGFALVHAPQVLGEWPALFRRWLAEGMTFPHTSVDGGLPVLPDTLVALLAGHHRGHVSVRMA
ncbi:MDR family NADP-dependent oxidoreductase [Umezawaea tangerina]|nr:NADP-dependent oxidoreductase [Umezawaea tangerina]